MIVSCQGDIAIHGSRDDVYADFGIICCNLLKEKFSKEELAQAIVMAQILNKKEGEENGKSKN